MASSPAAPAAQPAFPPAPPANPVDEDYLKHLIDQELGPPKFAVRKPEAPPPMQPPSSSDEQSLQELLDQAFGPPKFAVPKPRSSASSGSKPKSPAPPLPPTPDAAPVAPAMAAAPTPAPAPATAPPPRRVSGMGQGHGVKRSAQEAAAGAEEGAGVMEAGVSAGAGASGAAAATVGGLVLLTLNVTQGPAAGRTFVADDPSTEYKIGRLPDCSFQILDQEISGRHASLRWDSSSGQWKLHDVGSLNGTSVCGAAIGRDYKVPGQEVALRDGDTVELGTVTRLRVALREAAPAGGDGSGAGAASRGSVSGAGSASAAAAAAAGGAGGGGGSGGAGGAALPPKRQHTADVRPVAAASALVDPAGAGAGSSSNSHGFPSSSGGVLFPGPSSSASAASAASSIPSGGGGGADTLSGVSGLSGTLPAPAALLELPALGARLCVHNRLGSDHKRMSQGCEDVPYWELPYAPYDGAGIICVFDGHHGSKAAEQAKEHLPAILRHKLLLRDGRQPPPLPPPPPPRKPRRADGEEGAEEEGEEEEKGVGMDGHGQGEAAAAVAAAAGPASQQGLEAEGRNGAAPPEGQGSGVVVEGGKEAADGAASLPPPPPAGPPLPPLLRGREAESQKALLKDTFLAADRYMSMEEGCTATVVLLEAPQPAATDTAAAQAAGREGGGGWRLQSANVGDSSALLVNLTRCSWAKLSEDHRIASSVSERQRLAARGHTVRTRLYGLNISRMLGDRFLKEEDLGFLAEPHVSGIAQVGPGESALLVVASDGLWDVLPEERAAKLILQEASKAAAGAAAAATGSAAGSAPHSPPHAPHGLSCHSAADLLLAHALVLRSRDDITIAVLEMGPHLMAPGRA